MTAIDSETSLPQTGERYLPEVSGATELEHLHRYLLARQIIGGKRVLDLACGEGYGSFSMSSVALSVVGVDISPEAVLHAQSKYKRDNLRFLEGSCEAIPVADDSVDIVVSFETIEHHPHHEEMMFEIKRVLRPGGTLLISCPDKLEYSDKPGYANPYHVKELYRSEFEDLLDRHFLHRQTFNQRVVYGSLVLLDAGPSDFETHEIGKLPSAPAPGLPRAPYLLAIASDNTVAPLVTGLLEQPLSEIDEIVARDKAISTLTNTVNALIVDRDSLKNGGESLAKLLAQAQIDSLTANQQLELAKGEIDIARREVDLARIEAELAKDKIERAKREVDLAKSETAIARHEAAVAHGSLAVIYSSSSWLLTAPLRWVARRLIPLLRVKKQQPRTAVTPLRRELEWKEGEPTEIRLDEEKPQKRILLVSYYAPSRAHAGGLRILDIYKLIRQQCPNVEIELLTHHRPDIDWSIDEARSIFHKVYLSEGEDLRPSCLPENRRYVGSYMVADLQFHQTGFFIDDFRQIADKVIFTPMESQIRILQQDFARNSDRGRLAELRQRLTAVMHAAEEFRFCAQSDEVVCVSRSDAALLRKVTNSRHIRGVDTGISSIEFQEALEPGFTVMPSQQRDPVVLLIAYFGSKTNIDALTWYLEKVHPQVLEQVPEYRLRVIGRGDLSIFDRLRQPSVELIGEVVELAPHICTARVGIAPALSGSGFRGKVNQYAIFGVPCVVSPISRKGLVYQDGVSFLVGDTPERFAEQCIKLLQDTALNDAIGAQARKVCLEKYSWHSKWDKISDIYNLKRDEG